MFAASLIVAAHQLNSPPTGHHNLSPLQTSTVQGNATVTSAPAPAALVLVPASALPSVPLPIATLIEQGLELRQFPRNDTTDDDDGDNVIGPVNPPPLPAGSLLATTSTPSSPSRRRRWQFSRVPVVSEYVVPEVTITAAASEEQSHQHQGSGSGERISLDLEMARLAILPGGINDSNVADGIGHDDENGEHPINESTVDNVFDAMGRDDRTRVYRRLVGMQHRLVELTRLWGQRLTQVGRQNLEQQQSARNLEYPPPRPQPPVPVPAPVFQPSNARNLGSAEGGSVNTNVAQPTSSQRFVTVERSSNRIITTPYTADVPVSPELGPSSGLFKSDSSNSPFRNLNTGREGASSSARAIRDVDGESTAAQRSSCFGGILVKILGRKRPDPVQQDSPDMERPAPPAPPASSAPSHQTHESNRVLDGGQVLESERVQESVQSHRSDGTPGCEQTCEGEQAQENAETHDGELTRKANNLMRANVLL
ncbi:hypothetical protein BG011_000760 [Mortierella polycephala]|uniref:Uncharacterized protein n=1 Tax=Mortierella polycephala TaxID=41804 RepID=A0A9P6PM23_9FUNG|nr:hypothetical protein BG011_000760 [Mortierella polycephala]